MYLNALKMYLYIKKQIVFFVYPLLCSVNGAPCVSCPPCSGPTPFFHRGCLLTTFGSLFLM